MVCQEVFTKFFLFFLVPDELLFVIGVSRLDVCPTAASDVLAGIHAPSRVGEVDAVGVVDVRLLVALLGLVHLRSLLCFFLYLV